MFRTVFYFSQMALGLSFFCCAMTACQQDEATKTVSPAFYHWKTKLALTVAERQYLDSLGMKKLYAKFFDVDWDEATAQPVPLAVLEMDTSLLDGLEIVPVVFITNRTLLKLPVQDVDTLASRILLKIKALAARPPQEIQFDCDWTEQTREKYFALLNATRRIISTDSSFIIHHSSFIISATIRLHQFKYPDKTGVPPVDRGMLMCYNMGDLEDWNTENSIIGAKTATDYLAPQSAIPAYRTGRRNPQSEIPLDLALPTFRWGVLFRDGDMIKLLNDLSDADLKDTSRFRKTATNRYEVVKSTYLQAHYLYQGDQIRLEAATPEIVAEVAGLINEKAVMEQSFTVAFYHLDTSILRIFPKEKIREILRKF
ncbi:MAG: hypothetical protein IT258_22815 [Saprospiraceae bacterium]|nr:hypothetical protein [Saprospiraceae bacterium]